MKEPLRFLICYKFAKIAREKKVHFLKYTSFGFGATRKQATKPCLVYFCTEMCLQSDLKPPGKHEDSSPFRVCPL